MEAAPASAVIHISVIVPTFNEAQWIGPCLESLRAQDFDRSRFEIIVSDATSLDGTAEIARKLADTVVVGPKRGIAHGRNAGAAAARGDVFLFVDADTTLAPDFVTQIDAVFAHPHVVGCTGIPTPSDGTWFPRLIYRATYALVRASHALGLSMFPGICAAYRADAFRGIGGFREDLGITEDLDLSRRIRRVGTCVIAQEARAFVSTRRLERHALSTIIFHIVNDVRYLTTGRAARSYPKIEEMHGWTDIWRSGKHPDSGQNTDDL